MKKIKCLFISLIGFAHFVAGQTFEGSVNEYLASNNKISSVGLAIQVESSTITKMLREEIKNPILGGETPELGFMLHADESITIEKLEKVLVTPAKEAYDEIQRIPRTITETVKVGERIINCAGRLLRGKSCKEDILKTITRTVIDEIKVRIPAVEAVYKDVLVPVIQLNQIIFPIKGNFVYSADLSNITTSFQGNKYSVNAEFDINIRTNIKLDHLPQTITPKGSFQTKMKIRVSQNGYIEIKQNGQVQVSEPSTEMEFTELFGSGFVVDAIEFGTNKMPPADYLLDFIGKQLDKQLNKIAKKQIEKNTSKLNLKTYSTKLIKEFDSPIKIGENGYVYPNVTGVFVSQLNGTTVSAVNKVEIKVGVTFQPFATFEATPLPIKDKDTIIYFGTEYSPENGINLSVPVFLNYQFISEQLQPEIDDFNKKNENKFLLKKFKIDEPKSKYFDSGLINAEVNIFKRKKNKKIGKIDLNIHVSAIEENETICMNISKIKIKTSNLLIFLSKGYIKKQIKKEAEENRCINMKPKIQEARNYLDDKIEIKTFLGTIKGKTEILSISDVLPYPEYVLARVNLSSSLKINKN